MTDHQEMAGLLWSCYTDRMRSREDINMQFDLPNLLQRVEGLGDLSKPFTTQEMDDIIKYMPADKAPGPDGFNGFFLKKCWHLIKHDFYRLANDFFESSTGLENINGSLITLVPKIASPEGVNDFRPISLTNVCLKFITKILSNRLQDHILRCVHKINMGF